MLNRTNARHANREAEVERRLREPELRGRKLPARTGHFERRMYARIRWNFTGTTPTDNSEAEEVTVAGVALGRRLLVDGAASLRAVQPSAFGDAWYEVEPVGVGISSSKNSVKVRAVRLVNPGTASLMSQVERYAGTLGAVGRVLDSAGNPIQTSILGVAGDNLVPLILPVTMGGVTTDNYRWDAGLAKWTTDQRKSHKFPCLMPDCMQTGRLRSGRTSRVVVMASGTAFTLTGLSIDYGEAFDIYAHGSSHRAVGNINSIQSGRAVLSIWRDVTGTLQLIGFDQHGGIGIDPATPVNNTGHSTAISRTSGAVYKFSMPYTGSPGAFTTDVTMTFTLDAYGRITDITFTPGVMTEPAEIGVMVHGGRPPWGAIP
jgi:hypothetical protein